MNSNRERMSGLGTWGSAFTLIELLVVVAIVSLLHLKDREVMYCPADREHNYFEEEGTSYEYPHFLRGRPVDQTFLGKLRASSGQARGPAPTHPPVILLGALRTEP
ncbi:MAG: type II secretion system protein [Sedimentisphaerales bacterium]|nr:type II secretion system protein [Sedimentisphaerales bacterium]